MFTSILGLNLLGSTAGLETAAKAFTGAKLNTAGRIPRTRWGSADWISISFKFSSYIAVEERERERKMSAPNLSDHINHAANKVNWKRWFSYLINWFLEGKFLRAITFPRNWDEPLVGIDTLLFFPHVGSQQLSGIGRLFVYFFKETLADDEALGRVALYRKKKEKLFIFVFFSYWKRQSNPRVSFCSRRSLRLNETLWKKCLVVE